MYLDGALQFTGTLGTVSGDSPTTGAQTSTNQIDLLNARDLGINDTAPIKVLVQVITEFAGGTSLQVSLQGAPDNGSGAAGTWTTYATGPVMLEAALLVGARLLEIDMPRKAWGAALPRFLRLAYTSVGEHTAGAIYGNLPLNCEDRIDYPSGVVVFN